MEHSSTEVSLQMQLYKCISGDHFPPPVFSEVLCGPLFQINTL